MVHRARRNAGRGDVLVKVMFERVVTGHLMLLAAFLMHPPPVALDEVFHHLHRNDRMHVGEGAGEVPDPGHPKRSTPQLVPASATTQPTCVANIPGLSN